MKLPDTCRTLSLAMLVLFLGGCAAQAAKPVPASANLLTAGERLEASGDYDGALVQYVQALGSDDAGGMAAEAHYRIGRVHAALGNVATARDAFRRALGLAPEHAGALEGLGLLQLAAGDRAGAQLLLKKAADLDGTRWRAQNGLGVLADLAGDHALAQSYFNAVLSARPSEAIAMNNLGYSYYLGGQLDAARGEFERSVAQDPQNQKGWSNLALVQTRQGQYGQAVASLERIMSVPEARYSVGYLCLIDGKLSEAGRLLEDSIRRSDRFEPQAQAALQRVHDEQARLGRRRSATH